MNKRILHRARGDLDTNTSNHTSSTHVGQLNEFTMLNEIVSPYGWRGHFEEGSECIVAFGEILENEVEGHIGEREREREREREISSKASWTSNG